MNNQSHPLLITPPPGGVQEFSNYHAVDKFSHMIHICITMKTATIRDLRNHFPRVAAWIAEGEPVEITKAGKLFARLVPPTPVKTPKLVKPDIMARLKETWGDRVFSAKEVAEMRAAELDSEDG
jgi:antitoxin (DNA-binding transcriptional repressor) of toxin-antitoxin stability system